MGNFKFMAIQLGLMLLMAVFEKNKDSKTVKLLTSDAFQKTMSDIYLGYSKFIDEYEASQQENEALQQE